MRHCLFQLNSCDQIRYHSLTCEVMFGDLMPRHERAALKPAVTGVAVAGTVQFIAPAEVAREDVQVVETVKYVALEAVESVAAMTVVPVTSVTSEGDGLLCISLLRVISLPWSTGLFKGWRNVVELQRTRRSRLGIRKTCFGYKYPANSRCRSTSPRDPALKVV